MMAEVAMMFNAVDPELLFSKNDPRDPRLGDRVNALPATGTIEDLKSTLGEAITRDTAVDHYVLAGYPDDEGIRINGGRPGAAGAPAEVRRWLYRMTPSATSHREFQIWDAGNLELSGNELEQRHSNAAEAAQTALTAGARWIGIGGGHDYGYCEASAFIHWAKAQGQRPMIINFDAHLDVRPVDKGLSSGTPFFRMLESFSEIDFAEIGIQSHCNSRAHLEWVKSKGARVLMQEEVEASGRPLVTQMIALLDTWLIKPRPVFISVDIDAFSSAVAPGCSQSWATGFDTRDFFPALMLLKDRLDVRALGVYEVSPPLDHDGRTAKLAAQVIHRLLP